MKSTVAIEEILGRYSSWLDNRSTEWEVNEPILLYGGFFNNKLRLVKAIRAGMPFHFFSALRSAMPFTDQEWADFMGLSLKSLQRYQTESGFVFKSIHTEKILELSEVTQLGDAVFDTPSQFHHWLRQSHIALGGIRPFELISDSYGKDLVVQELHRIDHGIFS